MQWPSGAPGSTWESQWHVSEQRAEAKQHLGALTTSLGAPLSDNQHPGSTDHKPASADHKFGSANHKFGSANHKPGSMLNHCRAVWENIIFFGNAGGVPGNQS